jgi:integrase
VFSTLEGRDVDQSYVRHLLPRLARKAGIEKRVHAHALRHAYAVELEREGATVSTIRDLLGHSSAAVTDRYLRRLGATEGGRVCASEGLAWHLITSPLRFCPTIWRRNRSLINLGGEATADFL